MNQQMVVSVLIPTFKRVEMFRASLDSLKKQTRLPDEVVVVVRDIDIATQEFLKEYDPAPLKLRPVFVYEGGQVQALCAGIDAVAPVKNSIVAITDDDTVLWPDWVERIEKHFQDDPLLWGVGGRDWVYHYGKLLEGSATKVGRVQWFGRYIGNQHLALPSIAEVDFLKGANMSYRRDYLGDIRPDRRLLGSGSQIHNDMNLGLQIRKAGGKMLYDPAVSLDHHLSERMDEDKRHDFNEMVYANVTHNQTLTILEYLPKRYHLPSAFWCVFIGTREAYGIVQLLRFLPKEKSLAWQKFVASMKGRKMGWQSYLKYQKERAATSGATGKL